jgi:hypothetical protein
MLSWLPLIARSTNQPPSLLEQQYDAAPDALVTDAAHAIVTQAREVAASLDGISKASERMQRLKHLSRSDDLGDRLAAAIYRAWKAAEQARKKAR